MRLKLHFVLPALLAGAAFVMACSTVRVSYSEMETQAGFEVLVVDSTLKLFWELADLQVGDPSLAQRLLETDPREPSEALRSLGVDFDAYRRRLAEQARVSPLVLFLPRDADPVTEARRRELAVAPWPGQAPPALLVGPEVDVLVLFEPVLEAEGPATTWRGRSAGPRLASLSGLAALALGQVRATEPLARRLYRVLPAVWSQGADVFEHTRCEYPEPEMRLVTKLTYRGGSTDTLETPLSEETWEPCALAPDPDLRAATVRQPSQRAPGGSVIIASSYFQDPYPGPLLARWIEVR